MSAVGARLVVLIGHPRPGSRTHAVARQAGTALCTALAGAGVALTEPDVVDLATLMPHLLDRHDSDSPLRSAIDSVTGARLLVAASPTFRGAYSGLLKLFLDALPRDALTDTVAVPLMTAGLAGHRAAVDTALRPVLRELRAHVPAVGISVLEGELARFDEVFSMWWSRNGSALAQPLRDRLAAPEEVRS